MKETTALVLKKQEVEREIAAAKKELVRAKRWWHRLQRVDLLLRRYERTPSGWRATILNETTWPAVHLIVVTFCSLVLVLFPSDYSLESLERRLTELQVQRDVLERNILTASRPNPYRD